MADDRKFRWVGTRPIRHDGVDKVTGRANFGADFWLPGMLHGRVLRSPHAHARIVSIDVSPALALDGVKAVMTGADLPDISVEEGAAGEGPVDFRDLSLNILARDKVLYDGHAVAAVAATSARAAEEALSRIDSNIGWKTTCRNLTTSYFMPSSGQCMTVLNGSFNYLVILPD